MELNHFGQRLSYLRWLKHLFDGSPPTMRALADAVERHGVTVGDWLDMEKAPKDRDLDERLERYFGTPAAWIIKGEGEPPEPDLWKVWTRQRRADPKQVPAGAVKQITRADVAAAPKKRKKA